MATWKLYYDGGCNLCHVSSLKVEKWAKRANQPLEVDVLASDEAIAKGYGDAMTLEADGKVFQADQAWIKLCSIGPSIVRAFPVLNRLRFGRAVLRWFYNIVAKYRLKWFGTRDCNLPPSDRKK